MVILTGDDTMVLIQSVLAREIIDSRGNPTVEVEFVTARGVVRASVPSGASTGTHEAHELRDGGKRFLGLGVLKSIGFVHKVIGPKIVSKKWKSQDEFDLFLCSLDGTASKRKLGANTILACSLAFARAWALEEGIPLWGHIAIHVADQQKLIDAGLKANATLKGRSTSKNVVSKEVKGLTRLGPVHVPRPFFNILNGGKHADSGLCIQEFMIAPNMKSFSENLRVGSEVYHTLKKVIHAKYGAGSTNVGDEGGFACAKIKTISEALDVIVKAITEAGYTDHVDIALDCAASEFYDSKRGKYNVDGKWMSAEKLGEFYCSLVARYRIISIEDPFFEEDFARFAVLRKMSGVQVVGDDLTVTNPLRVARGLRDGSITCLLLKVNQIGTLTEAISCALMMRRAGLGVMVSHRSGETEDTFISHLAVGLGCGMIKSGAPCRGERVSKYNELLRIEEELRLSPK